MAAHEGPEWEVPAGGSKSGSFWQRFSKTLNSWNTILSTPKSSIDQKSTSMSTEANAPSAQIQTFDDKDSFVATQTTRADTVTGEEPLASTRGERRRICGRSRRTFIFIAVAAVVLLALVIGLAAGLSTHKKSSAQDLPLPTNNGIFTGDLTYYSPGPGYGACGFENTSQDSICAVSHIIWDAASTSSNPNDNPLCGKKIRITRYDSTVNGNRSVDVEVVDRCVGCKATDLDLSLKMFDSLAEESQGRVVGSWAWL